MYKDKMKKNYDVGFYIIIIREPTWSQHLWQLWVDGEKLDTLEGQQRIWWALVLPRPTTEKENF